jgi:hypothetical protein
MDWRSAWRPMCWITPPNPPISPGIAKHSTFTQSGSARFATTIVYGLAPTSASPHTIAPFTPNRRSNRGATTDPTTNPTALRAKASPIRPGDSPTTRMT